MIYLGVCEDNNDTELKLGRIKVRIFGKHTEIKAGMEDYKLLSVRDLPWAMPAYPINTQSIDGMSDFQVPANGSNVLVTYLDDEEQVPIYFATVPKIANLRPNYTLGFSDPEKVHPSKDYLKESPISRLARNENIDKTIIKTKKDNVKTGIDCKEETFDEPETPYATKYPNNRVIETKAGHFIEIDDTEGAERIHIYHKSGTFEEIHPNGQKVIRTEGKRTSITIGDSNVYIEGSNNIHITKSQNIHIKDSRNVQIDGNEDTDITGSEKRDVGGSQDITVGGSQNNSIGGSQDNTISGSQETTVGALQKNTVAGIHETTAAVITLKAAVINLN